MSTSELPARVVMFGQTGKIAVHRHLFPCFFYECFVKRNAHLSKGIAERIHMKVLSPLQCDVVDTLFQRVDTLLGCFAAFENELAIGCHEERVFVREILAPRVGAQRGDIPGDCRHELLNGAGHSCRIGSRRTTPILIAGIED